MSTPEQVKEVFAKADKALAEGRITAAERTNILTHYYGTDKQDEALMRCMPPGRDPSQGDEQGMHFTKGRIAVYALLIILAASALTYLGPGITGFVVLEIPQQNATNATIIVDQPVVGINVSGILYGEGTGTIYFDTPGGTYLVLDITSDDGTPRTDKPGYSEGEPVGIINAPADATYYFDDGTTSMPVDLPFDAIMNGTLLIVTASETYRLPIIIGEAQRATAFFEECIETCALPETNGSLRIETTGTAVLQLDGVQAAVLAENTPPEMVVPIGPLTINETVTIDLSSHFADADGDALLYSTSTGMFVDATINDSLLQLTPTGTGAENITIYVSDLTDLVPYTVEVDSIAIPEDTDTLLNETNGTEEMNETIIDPLNETNVTDTDITLNATQNITPANLTNMTLDCSGANPNALPEECLLQNASEYFPDQDIFWEDLDRQQVARFTVIGNMLITGEVIEGSAATPGSRDFSIGHADRDGNPVKTIWIDSSGNLHLRGTLHEENANLQPMPGTFSVITKRSVYLAYAIPETGDMYVRGNVIPYRRSIQ